jgi:hypothetical protein
MKTIFIFSLFLMVFTTKAFAETSTVDTSKWKVAQSKLQSKTQPTKASSSPAKTKKTTTNKESTATQAIVIDIPTSLIPKAQTTFQHLPPSEFGVSLAHWAPLLSLPSQIKDVGVFTSHAAINGVELAYTSSPWINSARFELRSSFAFGFSSLVRTGQIKLTSGIQKKVDQDLYLICSSLGLESRYHFWPRAGLSASIGLGALPLAALTNRTAVADEESYYSLGAQADLNIVWKLKTLGSNLAPFSIQLKMAQRFGKVSDQSYTSLSTFAGARMEL